MKFIIIYFFFFISTFTFSQNLFKKGIIIDSISINNTEKETFSLYLPTNYSKEKLSSIVYIFDPSAKGKKGIKPFIKASENMAIF